MVLRCAWGTCNADVRYPERLQGCKLVPFPKPKTQLDRCLRWIRACGRPHYQLNVGNINKHKAVCSKHFVGGKGPTIQYPDPVSAEGTAAKPARSAPKRRRLVEIQDTVENQEPAGLPPLELNREHSTSQSDSSCTQTEESWISPVDFLALASENALLQAQLNQRDKTIRWLRNQLNKREAKIKSLQKDNLTRSQFTIDDVLQRETKIKGLFKYYTGITTVRFMALLAFLVPKDFRLDFGAGRSDIKQLSYKNGLFFTICRLRHNYGLKDLSVRFGLSTQSASTLFKTWINHMYYKLGQISIWPHREVILKNMPKTFRDEFPCTLVIIDGTEFKTQVPGALCLQSQLYSDYKSSTTLKALIGCDPSGAVIFISELFTGSVSDKAITEQSGFYELLQRLKDNGYVIDGDGVMADKGFTIKDELEQLGLCLNIPPFAPSGGQLSPADIEKTQKIARHRIHIERVIRKVKTYKILSNTIPTSLFANINKIWTVCCYMTLLQDVFVKDK